MCVNMEPTRYWLLFAGILLIFLGSRIGQIICLRVFNMLRSAYYLAIAVLALGGALFFQRLGVVLLWIARRLNHHSENPDVGSSKRDTI